MNEQMTASQKQAQRLLSSTDGNLWATEFISVIKSEKFKMPIDHEFMIGWFANAIETGRSAGSRAALGDPSETPFWRVAKKDFADKTDADKALIAAIMALSVRGDFHLEDENGQSIACASITMEKIFELLVRLHDDKLMAHTR